MFDLSEFIRESNKIDVQVDCAGEIVPGAAPGEKMFDNQVLAYEFAVERIKAGELKDGYIQDIHRELTRGIDFFEWNGMSG